MDALGVATYVELMHGRGGGRRPLMARVQDIPVRGTAAANSTSARSACRAPLARSSGPLTARPPLAPPCCA